MKLFFVIAGSLYVLDVLTKTVIRQTMALGREISVLPFFSLVHVQNTGVAFGFLQGHNALLGVLALAICGFLIFYGLRLLNEDRSLGLIFAIILGGALGNVTDRLLFGHVTDFLDFFWGIHHWPAFNVADSSVCVGAALLFWKTFKKGVKIAD